MQSRSPSPALDPTPPMTPADDPEHAWREKQRRLAEARARILAAKKGDATAPDPPAPLALEERPSSFHPEASARGELAPATEPAPLSRSLLDDAAAPDAWAKTLADVLGETDDLVRARIHGLVMRVGIEEARALYAQVLEVEAHGGMWLPKQNRRRTPGGIFFVLVQNAPTLKRARHQEKRLFKRKRRAERKAEATREAATLHPDAPQAVNTAKRVGRKTAPPLPGEARTVKVTLVGRRGPIVVRDTCIATTMENRKAPDLPKGLPAPPLEPTRWQVFIAKKQWARVEAALASDPNDLLIVEGWGAFDAKAGMAVYATNTTTAVLQRGAKVSKSEPGAS